jgi:hypothetical protein
MSRVRAQARARPEVGSGIRAQGRAQIFVRPATRGYCGQHPAELDGKIPLQVLQARVNVYG